MGLRLGVLCLCGLRARLLRGGAVGRGGDVACRAQGLSELVCSVVRAQVLGERGMSERLCALDLPRPSSADDPLL